MWASIVPLDRVIALMGLLYILLFGLLSYSRREGLSTRFAVESLVITALSVLTIRLGYALNPVLFFFVLYTLTMRTRWLADLGNFLVARRRYRDGFVVFDLALRVWPDAVARRIVEINQAVAFLRLGQVGRAREALSRLLSRDAEEDVAPKHLAAIYYNLGVISRVEEKDEEARRWFNKVLDVAPSSIYGYGAKQALQGKPLRRSNDDDKAPFDGILG